MKQFFTVLFICILFQIQGQVGRVGINEGNPATELDIKTLLVDDGAEINLSNSDNSQYLRLFSGRQNLPSPIIYWRPEVPLIFGTNTIGKLDFKERFRIQGDGNIGLGMQNPINNLHIRGPIKTGITIEAESENPFIQLTSTIPNSSSTENEWNIQNDISNDKSFEVNYKNNTGLTLDTTGRLGIKTSSPITTLDVNGSFRIGGLAGFSSPFMKISSGTVLTYDPVVAVNGTSFHCLEVYPGIGYTSSGSFAYGGVFGSSASCTTLVSNINLNHEDRLETMFVRFYDQSGDNNIRVRLMRADALGAVTIIGEVISNDNTPTFTAISRTLDFSVPHIVDNGLNSYYLTVDCVNNANAQIPWDNSIAILSVHVQ